MLVHFIQTPYSFQRYFQVAHKEMFSLRALLEIRSPGITTTANWLEIWKPKGTTPITASNGQWQYGSSLRRQSQRNALKRQIMTWRDWGESSYPRTTECLTTSVLILSPGSGHETDDILWKIHFISCKHLRNHGIPNYFPPAFFLNFCFEVRICPLKDKGNCPPFCFSFSFLIFLFKYLTSLVLLEFHL